MRHEAKSLDEWLRTFRSAALRGALTLGRGEALRNGVAEKAYKLFKNCRASVPQAKKGRTVKVQKKGAQQTLILGFLKPSTASSAVTAEHPPTPSVVQNSTEGVEGPFHRWGGKLPPHQINWAKSACRKVGKPYREMFGWIEPPNLVDPDLTNEPCLEHYFIKRFFIWNPTEDPSMTRHFPQGTVPCPDCKGPLGKKGCGTRPPRYVTGDPEDFYVDEMKLQCQGTCRTEKGARKEFGALSHKVLSSLPEAALIHVPFIMLKGKQHDTLLAKEVRDSQTFSPLVIPPSPLWLFPPSPFLPSLSLPPSPSTLSLFPPFPFLSSISISFPLPTPPPVALPPRHS
eukprot:Cvel_33429.t1-p1 / transcript=Cvel_33429.t1 / gene=Cvel_33429 / organism=Chromera_velia_CCMP2878 / gene_product=hypothetical protein / transcript_product=hypothetical protein / location=Cvel_scaffold5426:1-1425(-) / protein_length=341 / sequence_SO=supercontig / SO=protein_coding / is_pseudo=false